MMELFENENFLAIDKPGGTLSVPGRAGDKDPRPCAIRVWTEKKGFRLWPVHRLDSEVSGTLLFAKNAEAHRAANGWFERHEIKKRYEALTEVGTVTIPAGEVEWKSLLWRGKKRVAEKPFGKKAVTRARFVKLMPLLGLELALWELWPLTGRSHQLRFELFKHGHPIWGDELYGSKLPPPQPQTIGLRAVGLDLSQCPEASQLGLPARIDAAPLLTWLDSGRFVPT